jgi:NADH-quinone oxidoreductase subunit N
MTAGNLLAMKQTNLKRLLAYSSISHAGYLLMGIAAFSDKGVSAVLFYLFAYLLMNGGAFLILTITINKWGSEDIEDYNGLAWRGGHSSVVALGMAVFLFSLAGLPPFAGFIGKWYIFAAAVEKEMYFLVIVGLINVVISLYYYARIVKAMYLVQEPGPKKSLSINFFDGLWMGTLGVLSIYFGIFFSPFFTYLQSIIPK